MRLRLMLCVVAVLVLEGAPPHVPFRAAKDTHGDIARAAERSAELDAAKRDGGVYEPGHKAGGAISRALQRLRSAVGRRRK